MIRDIVKPNDTHLMIDIPQEYVGKTVEYIVFPIEESKGAKKRNNNAKSLKGVLSKYANKSKLRLEDEAWRLHIKQKYKQND
jgi:pentose-5-phosphate-3-epimerase